MRTQLLARIVTLCALLTAAGCSPAEHTRSNRGDSLPVLAVNPRTPAGRVALDIWELRPGVMLADWLTLHGDDDIQPPVDSGPGARLGDWCVRAVRTGEVGALAVERAAYFYPPPLTDSLVLPDSAPEMVRFCQLGAVTSTIVAPDSARGAALADSLRTTFGGALGDGERDGRVVFYGSAFWSVRGRFAREGLTVVSALASPPGRPATHAVFALGFLPVSRLTIDSVPGNRAWQPYDVDSIPYDTLLLWADLPARLAAEVRRLRDTALAFAGWQRSPVTYLPSGTLADLLRRLVATASGLPPGRRAAALTVADRLLFETMCQHGLCHDESGATLQPFRALGARFTFARHAATWAYERNWLGQARNLDRDSPLGQRILLAQLVAGFDFSGTCSGGAESFRRVIENGERYLARVPGSPVAADVRFLLAEAYRDIAALAQGSGGVWADSSRYSGEAGRARRRALEHYRAVIAARPLHGAAETAWRSAWRLASGLPLRGTRYLCVVEEL